MYRLATKHNDGLKADQYQKHTSGVNSRFQFETVNRYLLAKELISYS